MSDSDYSSSGCDSDDDYNSWPLEDLTDMAYCNYVSDKASSETHKSMKPYKKLGWHQQQIHFDQVNRLIEAKQRDGEFKPTFDKFIQYVKNEYNVTCTRDDLLGIYKLTMFK